LSSLCQELRQLLAVKMCNLEWDPALASVAEVASLLLELGEHYWRTSAVVASWPVSTVVAVRRWPVQQSPIRIEIGLN
jgi:hypothetical protein